MKKIPEATKTYDYIISQNFDNFLIKFLDILEQAANFYEDLGENHKALEIFEKILEENNNEEVWLRCGILYKKIGDIPSAIDAFKSILESNPKLTEAKINLSNIYLEEGNKKEALKILDNEEVFFSDDEGLLVKEEPLEQTENSPKINKRSKKINKIKKNVKFDEANLKKNNINNENDGVTLKSECEEGMQSFGEKIELSIDMIKRNYDVDDLRLKFIQAQILLKENSEEAFLEKIYDSLIVSLRLENEIQVFFIIFLFF